jgi:hypothetical protein
VDKFWKDVRHSLRVLTMRPAFLAVAFLTLALAIWRKHGAIQCGQHRYPIHRWPVSFARFSRLCLRPAACFPSEAKASTFGSIDGRAEARPLQGQAAVDSARVVLDTLF